MYKLILTIVLINSGEEKMSLTIKNTKIIIFSLAISFNVAYSQKISLESLLLEMTNRETLVEYPSPSYICKQFSSYDRTSVESGQKSWFANWDRSMFIRKEANHSRNEYVLMEAKGPGAIVRMWMTFSGENSGRGVLRIYLDDYSTPIIEGDALDIISGGKLTGEPLSASVSNLTDYDRRGHNLYLPIPYAEKCKITYESDHIKDMGAKTGGEAVYYHINYRTYEDKALVKTFELDQLQKLNSLLRITQQQLTRKDFSLSQKIKKKTLQGTISVGKNLDLTIIDDYSAIRKITLKMNAENDEQALRSTILHISFDGVRTISAPVGDFFGTGYKIRKNHSWYTKVDDDGTMSCYWVMPFKKECNILLENRGNQDVNIELAQIITHPYKWTANTMYFCAYWKQYSFLETGEMKNNEGDGFPFDINYVNLKGRGVYVGDCLTLFNTVYAWWGEGDEKIYVDGETFPSHFGTGTEDYYGYAWCRPEPFTGHPFIAQPDGSGNFDPGYTHNLRFRSLDAIPFRKSLKFDMEMWHWTKAVIHFAPITFWYINPQDARSIPSSDLSDAALTVAMKREDIISPAVIDNKIEGENMVLEGKTGGNFRYSNNVHRGWSNNMQILWSDLKPNDTLSLFFVSDTERKSDITVRFSKGVRYGSFKLSVNQSDISVIEASAEQDTIGEHTLKNVVINKGKNLLKIVYLKPEDKNQIGIDCIELSD